MPSDCLVLQIEEVNKETNVGDHKIYIVFDKNENHYVLRGKRNDTSAIKFNPYSFESDSKSDIVDFLSFIMETDDLLNYRLYNNSDLPWESNDITFEDLDETLTESDELVGYDMDKFSKKRLTKRISFLRKIYNFY
jgi:hypothetical protein